MANRLLRQGDVHEQRCRFGRPSRAAAWAKSSALAREGHELLGLAGVALNPNNAVLEQSALHIGLELVVHIPRQRAPLGSASLPEMGIVLGHELVEERRFRPVPPIPRRGNEISRLRNVAIRRTHAVRPHTASTG
jgi:hypothetical protein